MRLKENVRLKKILHFYYNIDRVGDGAVSSCATFAQLAAIVCLAGLDYHMHWPGCSSTH